MDHVTKILNAIEQGDTRAVDNLLPAVYQELRQLAAQKLSREKPGQTLQPTALVHEVYLRLLHDQDQTWKDRTHFFSAAAEAMRRILVDNARRRRSLKAGGDMRRVGLDDLEMAVHQSPDDVLAIDDAITKLVADDPVAAKLAKLRLFAGMTVDEAAESLGMSRRTGYRHWTYARAFLQLRIQTDGQQPER